MHCFKLSFLLLLLIPLLSTITSSINPLHKSCKNSHNHTTNNDIFASNLNQLLFQLSKTSPSINFGLNSIGKHPNKVNGIALCRGDIKRATCKKCIRNATTQILNSCTFKKQGIVIYEECMIRYSDSEFFGEADEEVKVRMCDDKVVGNIGELEKVSEMMSLLKRKAHLSPLLYATTAMEEHKTHVNLYGMAQCSNDVSGGDCEECLEKAIEELDEFCKGRRGGRVVLGSCSVRYEFFPFFDS